MWNVGKSEISENLLSSYQSLNFFCIISFGMLLIFVPYIYDFFSHWSFIHSNITKFLTFCKVFSVSRKFGVFSLSLIHTQKEILTNAVTIYGVNIFLLVYLKY